LRLHVGLWDVSHPERREELRPACVVATKLDRSSLLRSPEMLERKGTMGALLDAWSRLARRDDPPLATRVEWWAANPIVTEKPAPKVRRPEKAHASASAPPTRRGWKRPAAPPLLQPVAAPVRFAEDVEPAADPRFLRKR
jgi:hypothetical protein